METMTGPDPDLMQALASQQPSLESCFQEQQAQLNKALRRRQRKLPKRLQRLEDVRHGKRKPHIKGPAPGLELIVPISKTKFVTLRPEQAHFYNKIKAVIYPDPGAGRYIQQLGGRNSAAGTNPRGKITIGSNELKKVGRRRNKRAIPENEHEITLKSTRQKRRRSI